MFLQMKKEGAKHNSNIVAKAKSADKQRQYRHRRLMQLAIQASIALSVIGAIIMELKLPDPEYKI